MWTLHLAKSFSQSIDRRKDHRITIPLSIFLGINYFHIDWNLIYVLHSFFYFCRWAWRLAFKLWSEGQGRQHHSNSLLTCNRWSPLAQGELPPVRHVWSMSMEKLYFLTLFKMRKWATNTTTFLLNSAQLQLKCLLKVDLIFSVLIYDLFLQRVIIASVNINTLRQRICFRTDAAVAVIAS